MNLTVCCVKTPPAYDHHYVNRLYRAVREHLNVPHRFVCFTNDASGLKCPSRPINKGLRGWWGKLYLFKPGILQGRVIYLDLDTLLLGDLSFLAEYEGDFAILEDFYRPGGYGSGVMVWNKPQPQVWEDWIKSACPDDPLGDQGWMERKVKADYLQSLFPGKIVSFKEHCTNGPPERAAVCCFHGVPKPHDFPHSHWVHQAWTGRRDMADAA